MSYNDVSAFAKTHGFNYDAPTGTAYGLYQNYYVTVTFSTQTYEHFVMIPCAHSNNETVNMMNNSLAQLAGERQDIITRAGYGNGVVTVAVNDRGDVPSAIREALNKAVALCGHYGFAPICRSCGSTQNLGFTNFNGQVDVMCGQCAANRQAQITQQQMAAAAAESQKKVNWPLGLLGGFLGALIGAVIWVVVYQLGFVLFIAGALTVGISYALFKKMGGKITLGGIVFVLAISLVMLCAAEYVSIGLTIHDELSKIYSSATLSDAFELIPEFMQDSEIVGAIVMDVIYGMVSYIIVAVGIVVEGIREQKKAKQTSF